MFLINPVNLGGEFEFGCLTKNHSRVWGRQAGRRNCSVRAGKVGFTALQWAVKPGDVLEAEKSCAAPSATLGSVLGL